MKETEQQQRDGAMKTTEAAGRPQVLRRAAEAPQLTQLCMWCVC